MGLLDDAIREHIELKRAHGADPAEVARLERDAFGPASQAPQPLEIATEEPREPVDPALLEPQVDAPLPVEEPPPIDEPLAVEPEHPVASEALPPRMPEPPVPEPEPEPVVHQHVPEPEPEPELEPAAGGAELPHATSATKSHARITWGSGWESESPGSMSTACWPSSRACA